MLRSNLISSFLAIGLFSIPATFADYQTTDRPNVVFILADDQDAQMNSLEYMPILKKHLLDKGTHFKKHYCTVALCCPSRATIWTGKTAHNHNVTSVDAPHGGYPKVVQQGINENYLPVWLQEAGYNTYYTGKLWNAHTIANYYDPYPSGFTGTDFLLDPNTYSYLDPIFQRNEEEPVYHKGEYNTDLVAKKGLSFLDDAAKAGKPFFVTIAPIAPHAEFDVTVNGIDKSPPIPADRHKDLFGDVSVPRTPNFNPDVPSGADWIAELPQLSAENITYNDLWYRQRLRSLAAIDEMIEDVIAKLEDQGILDNTYIIYSSDNGYHISQHRLEPGKGCGFEEDINVPLIVRGPGVPEGEVVELSSSHVDLAPTFFDLLGIPLRDDFDGVPIPLKSEKMEEAMTSGKSAEHVQVEFWSKKQEGEYTGESVEVDNTFKGIRIVNDNYGFYYQVWCGGDHELYDMKADPYQMKNIYSTSDSSTTFDSFTDHPVSLEQLQNRLDSLLMVLKTCKGKTCSDPWNELLPDSGVTSLQGAMDTKYDSYFASLPRVDFDSCEEAYFLEAEGPMWEGEGFVPRRKRRSVGMNRA